MVFAKIGFHMGTPCNGCTGMGDMWRRLNEAGVPFGIYSVDNGGIVAVDGARYSHADPLIYRTTKTDVAPYNLMPKDAAMHQWTLLMAHLPPEVKALKSRIWLEIGNEQDKTRADWLGNYYAELAAIALPQGYRICGPGWATGEPEPADWETPGWLRFLRLCAANPSRLAITVHEYSLNETSIMAGSPWLIGRFQQLFKACDRHGIARPPVFVTELGWVLDNMPEPSRAMEDINTVAALYAGHPQIKAAFLWSLIGGGDKVALAQKLNGLIEPVTTYTLNARWPDPPPPPPIEVKKMMIDVSHWQKVDWPKVAAKLDGVFIRLGYGLNEDREARRNVAECKRLGIPFATYHYFVPTVDAVAQGEFYGRLAKELAPDVRVCVDLEEKSGVVSPTAILEEINAGWMIPGARLRDDVLEVESELAALEQLTGGITDLPDRAKRYIDALEAAVGHVPAIYTSPGYWRGWMRSPAWGQRYPLWIAHWGMTTPDVPWPFGKWDAHQYNVLAVNQSEWPVGSNTLDFDRFNGTPAEFAAWAKPGLAAMDPAALIKADALTRPAPTWNPAHALPLAALAQRFYPFGEEYDVVTGGKTYRYLRAMDATGKRRAYWAAVGDWGNVKAVDLA